MGHHYYYYYYFRSTATNTHYLYRYVTLKTDSIFLERRHHERLQCMYNKINYIRQHYLFYLYIRLHVSTHQSVILRPT